MKKCFYLCLSALVLTIAGLSVGANAAAPKRPMLEQGKTWYYVYHHFTDRETAGPDGNLYEETHWMSYYRLDGDTIIDGRQYMKMYRWDDRNSNKKYYGAFREDEEGRVYVAEFRGEKDFKLIDFCTPSESENDDYPLPIINSGSVIIETIKANGNLFTRYRYTEHNAIGIEGVGYKRYGLVTSAFEEILPCICDYEELYSVDGRDFWFNATDFDAPKQIELADGEQELINCNNDFAFNLFRKARDGKSMILSPLSITFALGMLNNGADGQTLQEINQTLGFGEAGADAINAFCQKMLKEANTLDDKTKAMIANTIFVNEALGIRLQDGFVGKANEFYDAQPQNRDFYDGETMNVINQWASDHTMGMIPEVLNEKTYKPDNNSYLLNALYFKGIWSNPFNVDETQEESFGGGPEVPMMHKSDAHFSYAGNDLYQAAKLPYGNGAYQMTIFLPREGYTVGEVLETLNGSNWQPQFYSTELDLKLPRFETDTNQDLAKVMSDLGMPTAFKEYAEFPYYCNVPACIGQMFQVAKIKLDEQGTEAAAVTVIGMETTGMPSPPVPFYANRPFLYVISEQSTGAIFFIGQYSGGVDADTRTGIIATKVQTEATANNQIFNLSGQQLSQEPPHGLYIKNGKVVVK